MESELPEGALLRRYAGVPGAYVDGWTLALPQAVTQAQYVEAFYTTWLFRLERAVLALLAGRPSSDAQAARLARGEADAFAAWTVEDRAANQLLLRDFLGRTRSWLMCEPGPGASRLWFGSAVVPAPGRGGIGRRFGVLLGLHRLYSRLLLRACARRLRAGAAPWS